MPEGRRTISLEIDDEAQGLLLGRVAEGDRSHEFEGWLGPPSALGAVLDHPAVDGDAAGDP